MAVTDRDIIDRDDANDVVYRTEREKWNAIVDEIAETNERGQPMLVGTTSVEKSERRDRSGCATSLEKRASISGTRTAAEGTDTSWRRWHPA